MNKEEENWITIPDEDPYGSVKLESIEAIQRENEEYRENCE